MAVSAIGATTYVRQAINDRLTKELKQSIDTRDTHLMVYLAGSGRGGKDNVWLLVGIYDSRQKGANAVLGKSRVHVTDVIRASEAASNITPLELVLNPIDAEYPEAKEKFDELIATEHGTPTALVMSGKLLSNVTGVSV